MFKRTRIFSVFSSKKSSPLERFTLIVNDEAFGVIFYDAYVHGTVSSCVPVHGAVWDCPRVRFLFKKDPKIFLKK